MSYIPNCRTDENYNEERLNATDREFVDGFDWCVEMALDNFFDNHFDPYDDTYLGAILNEELPGHDGYEIEFKYGDRNPERREIKTYADLLRSMMLDWAEITRNELITSMIDSEYDD